MKQGVSASVHDPSWQSPAPVRLLARQRLDKHHRPPGMNHPTRKQSNRSRHARYRVCPHPQLQCILIVTNSEISPVTIFVCKKLWKLWLCCLFSGQKCQICIKAWDFVICVFLSQSHKTFCFGHKTPTEVLNVSFYPMFLPFWNLLRCSPRVHLHSFLWRQIIFLQLCKHPGFVPAS